MKKYIYLVPAVVFTLFLALNFNLGIVKAQVNVTCPAGYTCTPVPNVPNCPVGYICTQTRPGTGTGDAESTPTSSISTSIVSNKLTLTYNSAGEQANLSARIAFTVNGGSKGVYIFKDTVGVDFVDQNGVSYSINNQTRILEAVSKVGHKTNVNGLKFFYVEPGTSTNFVINSSVPVNSLFAGAYRARALGLYIISSDAAKDVSYYTFTSNSSNPISVVGEKGPYIKSITNTNKPGDKVVVSGERLDGKKGDVINLFIDGVNSGLGFSITANGKEITFNLPRNISSGGHTLEVSSSIKGKSNAVWFTVGSENQSTAMPTTAVKPIPTTEIFPSASPATRPLASAIVSPANNTTVNVGNAIFIGEASGGTGSYKYMWNFGDGSPVSDGRLINGASEKIYHNFTKEGTYTVKLYVVDATSGLISNTSSIQVKVQVAAVSSVSTTIPVTPPASTVQIPSITSFYPTITQVGDDVALTGKGFDLVNTYDIYLENDKGAAINPVVKYKRADYVLFTVPSMPAGIYKLYIVGTEGNSNSVNLTIASKNGATVLNVVEWIATLFK